MRHQAIAEMRAAGKSTRAIADAVGVHHDTVCSVVGNPTTEQPAKVQTSDGKTYPAKRATKEQKAEREAKARELKAEGQTLRQIADELDISIGTVSAILNGEKAPPKPRQPRKKT